MNIKHLKIKSNRLWIFLVFVILLNLTSITVYAESQYLAWTYNKTRIFTNISDQEETLEWYKFRLSSSAGYDYSLYDGKGELVEYGKYVFDPIPKMQPGYRLVLTAKTSANYYTYTNFYNRTKYDTTKISVEDSIELANNHDYYISLFKSESAFYSDPGYEVKQPIGKLNINGEYIVSDFSSQEFVSQGEFSEFKDVYLNELLLELNEDYTAVEGSTKIIIKSQTLQTKANNNSNNTITVNFKNISGETKQSSQVFYLSVPINKQQLTVIYNGVTKSYEPIVNNGTSYIKARKLVEETLGGSINWDSKTGQITVEIGEDELVFTEKGTTYYYNGEKKIMVKNPGIFIKNGSTYVPVRFICEAFGMKVEYNTTTNIANIDKVE